MSRATLLSACLVLILTALTSAQVKLEHKLPEGASFTVENTQRVDQKLTIAGMDTETSADVRTVTKSTVGKRDGVGMVRVENKPESLVISMTVMGSNYFFDSANPDNAGSSALEMFRDLHKAISRRTSTVVYDKDNRVDTVINDQDVLNNVPEAVRNLAKDQLDPEYLKKAANQELAKLPTEAVKQGDSWQRTESVNFGAGQVMTFETRYTYEGTVEKDGRTLDKIAVQVLKVDFGFENSPLPLTVKNSQLKPAESEGVILFDRQRGQTAESNSKLRITGDILFVAGDQELPSKLDLKMESGATVKP
jgi:hypothetical protein